MVLEWSYTRVFGPEPALRGNADSQVLPANSEFYSLRVEADLNK